jgi:hypothetical protein
VTGWTQIRGSLNVLAARRGGERGSYLWLSAGARREAVDAEFFLPAVEPGALDGAMGVAVAMARVRGQEERSGPVRVQFGRVRDGRGVVSLEGAGIDADVLFTLVEGPPGGGFCSHCGNALTVGVVEVITPPDGGVIGSTQVACRRCGS